MSSRLRTALVTRMALGLVPGVLAVQCLPALPPPWVGLPLGLACVAGLRRGLVVLPALLFGLAWACLLGQARLGQRLPAEIGRVETVVEGHVLGIPGRLDRGKRFDFAVSRVLSPAAGIAPRRLRLSWYQEIPLKAGQRWRLKLSLRSPRGMRNPGGFDYEQWLFARGIGAVGYVREDPANQRLPWRPSPGALLQTGRQALFDRLGAVWTGSPVAGLLKALTMGEQEEIDAAQWEVLRRTGTAHLIAISGSHIGLVAGLAFLCALRLAAWLGPRCGSPPTLAAWCGMLSAFVYSALADFSIPTQRALVMIAVAMGAIIGRRHRRLSAWLALALVAVVLWDPLAVLAPGFWLSFGAVMLIAYTLGGRLRPPGTFRALARINWVTAIGLAPLLVLFFRQFSLVSPLANLLAVPVLGTLLIPVCLGGTLLLGIVPAAGERLLGLAEFILREAWRVLEWLAAWPHAQWAVAEPPGWTLALAAPGVFLLLAPRGIPGRWLGLLMLMPALLHQPERPAPGAFRLTLLDVGQGLAAVVETRRKVLVFDTGARFSPGFDMGGAVIEPFLRQRGIDRIDTLIVSHGDNDHIGGARSLLLGFPTFDLLTSVPGRLAEFRARQCQTGQGWVWDGVSFAILGPASPGRGENDDSCVLGVRGPGGSVLLTGDIEAGGERALLATPGIDLHGDILVVPHHGRATSSTATFIDRVSPRWALIPAGYLNRYGFPHPDVARRYRERGIPVLTTGESGALVVDLDGRVAAPRAYRPWHRRYWHLP